MVTEFWPGWFDHWGEPHHQMEAEKVAQRVSNVLEAGASINLYMFHGGTTFGFLNGANAVKENFQYQPTVSSYDYDAPLSEAGDVTKKYKLLRDVFAKYNADVKGKIPFEEKHERTAYEDVEMKHVVPLSDIFPLFVSIYTT
ncbi:PREDICTED: beta-galactosidase-1-like protein 2 [Acropora digitifera]|uniref:beta-galactosidase-1-like protein 2 n=1 Tax=Acropora digitifera TaxID=70779 RepID=UPI00077A85B9|nr:PREDICTED: beta-galactosidase-1-like protein 2 [Acropora digitifera]